MSKDDKSRNAPPDAGGTPFHNPFGALAPLRSQLPDPLPVPTAAAPAASKSQPSASGGRSIPRAVVRLERTGRGGKEVTVVEHMDLQPTERDRWLKALKAGLGCGGVVEGNNLVLQGDQRDRLPKLLTVRGVRKVTIG
ncbi:MAG TPA: translation initiation factor [Vicinamibacterales bacterium]|nr:translation initiation factor [Vicinamibacterales bacterium]